MKTKLSPAELPLIGGLIQAFFPKLCVCCGEVIDEPEYLCDECFKTIERCNSEKRCRVCGLEKGNCDCRWHVYYFEGCCAPFWNDGLAKKAMHSYKFSHKEYYAGFFAEQMALTVRNTYAGVRFDGVCYVPTTRRKKYKRGFDHCRGLALPIARIMEIPLLDNMLKCTRNAAAQHSLDFKERVKNVRDLYVWRRAAADKTLLLVDDIKTTGASIDECARQLLFAGAKNVYCVTALITGKNDTAKKKG